VRFVFRLFQNRDYFALVLLLIPAIVLTSDQSLIFNFAGYLDPWIYYSFFHHLPELKRLFPNTYYGSRLSWILPGYLIYHIFPRLQANYVLHLLVWYTCVLSMYVVIKEIADRRSALLSATVFGFCPYLWKATGWDYVDGAGLAYYMLTVACLVMASRSSLSRTLLFIAGITAAAAVYCNLFLALLVPFLFTCWLALRSARGCGWSLKDVAIWTGLGALLLTVALGIVNHRLDGIYQFYLPSIRFANGAVRGPYPRPIGDSAWIWHAHWLILPGLTLLAGAFACLRSLRRKGLRQRMLLAFYVNSAFCAIALLCFQVRFGPVLEYFYYVSYLLAPSFLFLGAYFFKLPNEVGSAAFAATMTWCIGVSSVVWWDRQQLVWHWLTRLGWGVPLVLIGVGFAAKIVWPNRLVSLFMAMTAAGVLFVCSRAPSNLIFSSGPRETEEAFFRITDAMEVCETIRHGHMIRFWLESNDPNNQEFASIASAYLYGFSLFSVSFPEPGDPQLIAGSPVLVVISSAPRVAERAEQAARRANICEKLRGETTISRGGVRYTLAFLDVGAEHCNASATIGVFHKTNLN
jgi:hypothetical protein